MLKPIGCDFYVLHHLPAGFDGSCCSCRARSAQWDGGQVDWWWFVLRACEQEELDLEQIVQDFVAPKSQTVTLWWLSATNEWLLQLAVQHQQLLCCLEMWIFVFCFSATAAVWFKLFIHLHIYSAAVWFIAQYRSVFRLVCGHCGPGSFLFCQAEQEKHVRAEQLNNNTKSKIIMHLTRLLYYTVLTSWVCL